MKNPFTPFIFEPGSATVPSVHQAALDALFARVRSLEEVSFQSARPGDSVLLTASRAGAGKTHLLARLQALAAGHVFRIPLRLAPEEPLGWKELTLILAAELAATPTEHGSALEETAWFTFARLVQAGLEDGAVVAADPGAARAQLAERYRDLFAPDAPESRARWFFGTADSLLASSDAACAAELKSDPGALTGWVRWLVPFAYPRANAAAARAERLQATLRKASGAPLLWKSRFQVLARLASAVRPLVWEVDHLDRFFSDPHSGRQALSRLSEVVELVPRSLLILSANQDLWQQVLLPGVPGAIQDRIAAQSITLGPLKAEQAEELLTARVDVVARADEKSRAFLRQLNLRSMSGTNGNGVLTPRALLRWASTAWESRDREATLAEPDPAIEEALTVQRTRERLHAVAEALRTQSGPASGGIHAASDAPPPPVLLPPLNPAPKPNGASGTLAEQFQAMRLRHLENGGVAPDWKRIHRFVAAVGDGFPSIRQRRLESEPGSHGEALCWGIANREIYIGFAPPTSYRFWRHLIASAEERETAPGSGSSSGKGQKRIVLLAPAGETISWEALNPKNGSAQLEIVPIDADLAASLHAADELLQTMLRGTQDLPPSRLFGFLAKELDFFWRRLTRAPKPATLPADEATVSTGA